MELYHYRSIDNALKEIENGTFRYSDRTEVNDPLEGHVKVYWKGDSVAWEGLFRNYICSLWQSIEFYLLGSKYEDLEENAVMIDIHRFNSVPMGDILKTISDCFIGNIYLRKIIKYFDAEQISCSAKTLRMLFRILHETAFSICICKMKEEKLIPDDFNEYVLPAEKSLKELVNAGTDQTTDTQRKVMFESVAIMVEDMIESLFLREDWELGEDLSQHQKWMKVRFDFPSIYVERLQEIIYPKGYFVCFSSDKTNSAMWGNYANNHTGVCLIYKTKKVNDKDTLSVGRGMINGKASVFHDDEIKAVKYDHQVIQRNFFESLGRMNFAQIKSWLAPVDGKTSDLLEKYKEDDWREKYWVDFEEKYCVKLSAWEHEKEYRLLITDLLNEYTWDNRFIKYKSEQFVGVIFGIKISEYDKKRVINAIKQQGKSLKDFEFFQAEYDDERNEIVVRSKYFSDYIFE